MVKMKRMSYDSEFKWKVIALADEKGNGQAAFEVGASESMVRKWWKQHAEFNAVADNTSKADNKLSDSGDDITFSRASENSQSDEAILSLFLSDTKGGDFSGFSAEEDWSIINHQPYCVSTFSSSFWTEQQLYFVPSAEHVWEIVCISVSCTLPLFVWCCCCWFFCCCFFFFFFGGGVSWCHFLGFVVLFSIFLNHLAPYQSYAPKSGWSTYFLKGAGAPYAVCHLVGRKLPYTDISAKLATEQSWARAKTSL